QGTHVETKTAHVPPERGRHRRGRRKRRGPSGLLVRLLPHLHGAHGDGRSEARAHRTRVDGQPRNAARVASADRFAAGRRVRAAYLEAGTPHHRMTGIGPAGPGQRTEGGSTTCLTRSIATS